MKINKTGKICDNLYMLGNPGMPIYLLNSEKPVIFDSGIAFLGGYYVQEIKEILGDKQPRYCMLTHSHFDHCGSAAFLKKKLP